MQSDFYRTAPTSTTGGSSSTTMMEKSRQLSVCTCAAKYKSMDSTTNTPTRKESVLEYEDDGIHIGREFGFSHSDAADRV
jgi:pheromone alpha factor receptor